MRTNRNIGNLDFWISGKAIYFWLLLLGLPFLSFSQNEEKTDSHFIALYTIGDSWDMDKPPQEQAYFKEHSMFLSQLRKQEKISVGARYSDTGMLIIQGKSEEEVTSMLHEDLAIQHKLFKLEIHPFAPFYKGCID
ncbi:MAG: hypothetical protein AAF969_10835 [Bacteroidota bacterium]